MTVKQDLKALNKDIQALGKSIEKLIAAAEKNERGSFAMRSAMMPKHLLRFHDPLALGIF